MKVRPPWWWLVELALVLGLLIVLPALGGCRDITDAESDTLKFFALVLPMAAAIFLGWELRQARLQLTVVARERDRARAEHERALALLHALATQAAPRECDPELFVVHRRPGSSALITRVRGGRA